MDFRKFEREKKILLIALSKDPERFANLFYIERRSGLPLISRNVLFSTYLTTNYQPLCDLISDKSQFVITTNKFQFLVKTTNISNLELRYTNYPPIPISNMEVPLSCISKVSGKRTYLGCDGFTNEFLIAYVIDSVYLLSEGFSSGLKGFVKYYTTTICEDKIGINLLEHCDLGNINSFIDFADYKYKEAKDFRIGEKTIRQLTLTVSTILDIFKQLISNLHFLQLKSELVLGNLDFTNIQLKTEKVEICYSGLTHNSGICVKISNFSPSAITVNLDGTTSLRIYNRNLLIEGYLNALPFIPQTDSFFNEPYYVIDDVSNYVVLAKIRSGLPFYTSFDTYTGLISLISLPGIFYQLFGSNVLREVFDLMFFPDEITKVYLRIYNLIVGRILPTYNVVLSVLNGIKLKCRLTFLLFDRLKIIKM